MPDIQPELPAVEAPESGLPSNVEEDETQPGAESQPRDPETGRFVPADPRAQAMLQKYGGDPEKALAAAVEAQDEISRQKTEIGELRQYRDYIERQQRTAPDQILAYADEDPNQATLLALQQYGRGSMPYERSLRTWAEQDPISASRFDTEVRIYEMQQQIQPQLQQYGLSSAMSQLTAKYPDLAEHREAVMREAEASPIVLALQEQGHPITSAVLETLYLAAKGRQTLAQNATHAHDANLTREQKLHAGIASATAARPGEPPPTGPDDEFRADYVRVAREMGLIPQEQ